MNLLRNNYKKIEILLKLRPTYQQLIEQIVLWLSLALLVFSLIVSFVIQDIEVADNIRLIVDIRKIFSFISIVVLGFFLSSTIRFKGIVTSFFSYIIYLIGSYFIRLMLNVNNSDFDSWNLTKNNFFQTNGLWIYLAVLSIALVLGVLAYREIIPSYESSISESQVLASMLAIVIMTDEQFLSWIMQLLPLSSENQIFKYIETNLIIPLIVAYVVSYCIVKTIEGIQKNKTDVYQLVFISLFFAIIFNYTLQFGIKGETSLLGKYMFPGALIFQTIFLATIFFLIGILINRFLLSLIVIIFIGTITSIANAVKFTLRDEPLLYTDLIWLKDIKLIFSFIDAKYYLNIIWYMLGISFVYFGVRKKLLSNPIISNLYIRVAVALSIITMFLCSFSIVKSDRSNNLSTIPIISKLDNFGDIGWLGSTANARYKSLMFVWFKQMTSPVMEKPISYSKETIEGVVEKYTQNSHEINQYRNNSIADQTIIYVLSESLSDPMRLSGLTVSKDPLDEIHKIMELHTSGIMKSDGYGGGTANMEFQSLFGLPLYNFSDSVSIAYTEVVPKLKYFPSITNEFSESDKIFIHPSSILNYNRNRVYDQLGFFQTIGHLHGDQELKSVEVVGANISDRTAYENVLKNIDVTKSQFFSVVTMQNHIPHVAADPEDIVVYGDSLSELEAETITSYARLLSYTDDFTVEFLNSLMQLDKKITVVFYGDHLPGIYPASIFENDPISQYETDFFIWSNYQTVKLNSNYVNSSDFPALLLEHTNSRVSPYYALLTAVLHDASVNQNTQNEEIATDLRMVQYDLTEGEGYLLDYPEFFKIGD